MNRIFLIMCLSILFSCCQTHKAKETNLKVKINIINKLDPNKFKEDSGTFYSINIELINNTDSIFRFWIMSCTYGSNLIFNMDSIGFYYYPYCTKNIPVIKEIHPKQKLSYNGILWIIGNLKNIKRQNLKLGFILIKENEIYRDIEFWRILHDKINKKKDIIWSDTFKINN